MSGELIQDQCMAKGTSCLVTSWAKFILLFGFIAVITSFNLYVGWWPGPTNQPWWLMLGIALCLTTYLPHYRRRIVGFFSMLSWLMLPWFHWGYMAQTFGVSQLSWLLQPSGMMSVMVAVLLFFAAYLAFCRRFYQRRWCRPILGLILLMFALIAGTNLVSNALTRECLTGFLLISTVLIWYFSYSLLEAKRHTYCQSLSHFSCFAPFWGGTAVPFAKGKTYLDKIEVKDNNSFSQLQLSAYKLLGLALIWYVFYKALIYAAAIWKIPALSQVLQGAGQQHYAIAVCWLSWWAHFVSRVLFYAYNSHLIIAVVRMAGFNAARNMDKPFFAKSIADFWNRYYFYFKELLVEVFFYPTYFSCFKSYPKLRLFFATFMAAGVGNFIYHYFKNINFALQNGLWHSLEMMQSYAFYGLVLSIGIFFSQLRQQKRRKPQVKWQRFVVTPIIVIGFFAILSVFNTPYQDMNLSVDWQFLAHLVGL